MIDLKQYVRPGDSPEIQKVLETARIRSPVEEKPAALPDLSRILGELATQKSRLDRLARDVDLQAEPDQAEMHRLSAGEMIVSGSGRKGLFDLFGVTATSFKIRGTSQVGSAAWIAGVKKSIGVSGVTWSTDHWASGTVSASEYVYLLLDDSAGTATITMATTLPAGTSTTRVFPLWYVPFAASAITRAGIVDMRPAVQLEDFAPAQNDHSWKFVQSSTTGGTVTLGQVFLGGTAKTVGSWPTNGILSGVTTTTKYWVAIDRSAATATWGSGASVPANTDTVEYWEVLELTCAGSVITGVKQRCCSDIRVTLFA